MMRFIANWRPVGSSWMSHCLSCGLMFSLAGCGILGAAAYKMSGEPEVPARYTPQKAPTLVLIENYRNPDAVALAAEQLTRQITVELRKHDVAPMIDPDALYELRSGHQEQYAKMNISAVGKEFKAKQVIYGDLIAFTVEQTLASDMVKGHAQIRVRVVEVSSGNTLWPTDVSGGESIALDTPYLHLTDGASEATVRGRLVTTLAEKVGQLFYKWNSDSVEGPTDLK